MASTPTIAASLIETSVILATVLFAQAIAVRHLPVESIPGVLRGRVAMCSRVRPWLLFTALAMAVMGLLLR
jgi:hypothetical protein